MVTDRTPRDRGQLILIGAVAIAFILLGIVVVFNSVLYTQAIASSDTVESSVDASATELELERGSSRLTRSANLNAHTNDSDKLENYLFEDQAVLWNYTDRYQRTKAETRSTVVGINESSANVTAYGRLVHQATEDNFTESVAAGLGPPEIVFGDPAEGGQPPRNLGQFVMTINVSSVDEPLEITLANETTRWNNVTIDRNADGNITVSLERELGSDPDVCELEPHASGPGEGNVTIDFVAGTAWAAAESGECEEALRITNGLDGAYQMLMFQNDGEARGTYGVVVSADNDTDTKGIAEPNYLTAWSLEYEYHYDSAEVSYTRPIEVDVYGGDA